MPCSKPRAVRYAVAGTVVSVIALIYFIFDPAMARWMPKCPLHVMTGLNCPGCGSQRMLHALLHLDFAAAWQANALLLLAIPYLILLMLSSLWPQLWPALTRRLHSPAGIITVTVVIVAWTVLRNIF